MAGETGSAAGFLSPSGGERIKVRGGGWDRLDIGPLCRVDPGLILTALIADFNGDGAADFLCAKAEGLFLFEGSPRGTFDQPPRHVWAANPLLKFGQVITCGDIDGDGHFTDVTRQWVAEPYAAGMGHAWADFDRDGRLDLLVMGMTSPTVDRLESLQLIRPDSGVDHTKRAKLMFGNRLLMAKADGGFEQTPLSDSIARSGWSWGCSAFDFDNDGFLDVYVANGHETKSSVRDYEAEYWLHDL